MNWNNEVDGLIIGSGFAGLSAAIEASQLGKNVLIIEKMKTAGGNSVISDGRIAAPNTDLQRSHGIKDSMSLMAKDMINAGLGLNDPILLNTMVENVKAAFDWTKNTLGVPYIDRVDIFGGHSVPRCYTPEGISGRTILKKMLAKVKELNIPILYNTAFEAIVTNQKQEIIGASVLMNYDYRKAQGDLSHVKTNKGIIIASGGYGADIDFRQKQDSRLDGSIQTTNKPFATAEVLKAAVNIGADTIHLDQIQLGAWASPDEKGFGHGPLFADYVLFQFGLIVDPQTGKRFVNELGDRKVLADALLNVNHPCIGFADQAAVDQAGWDLSKALRKGVFRTFDTLADLAKFYKIDEKDLKQSVNDYNNSVINGVDETYHKPIVHHAKPVVKPPFYAMRLWPKVHYTMGGLKINDEAKVLNQNNESIKGLFAAGEVTGGVHGASRLGSCAITECIVFGRIAGKTI